MCTPTVTKDDTRGNPWVSTDDLEACPRPGKPIPGWTGTAGPQARKRAARAARAAAASASARLASLRGFLRHGNILDCALFKAPAFDRRTEARHVGIVLTESERTTLRHLARQAANCGTVWMNFRGYDTEGPADRELRLSCLAKCGTRACAPCAAEIRLREAYRVEGPWNLFFTFTVPRGRGSAGDCWREVHGWIEALVRELRREVAWSRDDRPRSSGRRHERHVDRWIAANQHIDCAEKLEYAWVIEPHQDGYPHVHMVVNASWIQFDFLKSLWERCSGSFGAWVYGEQVYQVDGACRYLCKYIAKSVLSIEILALMYGRRLWASSIKAAEKPEPRWDRLTVEDASEIAYEVDNADSWGANDGWKVESSKPGAYALWSRELPPRVGVIVISEADDSWSEAGAALERDTDASLAYVQTAQWPLTPEKLLELFIPRK